MPNVNIMSLPKAERLEAIKAKFERSLPKDKRERMIIPGLEVRMDGEGDDESKHIEGYGAVFNSDSEGLWFIERVAPGAFAETIKNDDIVGLFNHDRNMVLGRTSAGTMALNEDAKGLFYSIEAPDTQVARDLHTSIGRGDIKGSSFSFQVETVEWSYLDDETVVRTLKKVRLFDVGPVTSPAYPASTTQARSIHNWIDEQKKESESQDDENEIPWELDIKQRRLDLAERESQ